MLTVGINNIIISFTIIIVIINDFIYFITIIVTEYLRAST